MAGHSKWANIKHRKARQDEKKAKVYTKLIREITIAAKSGGPIPEDNPRLRLALDKANGENMPKDTINRAIQRGAGNDDNANLEEVVYEGYGPSGVAILVETMTDNRNRTVADVRHAFTKHGGNLGTDGSVAYLFEKIGSIQLKTDLQEEELLELVIEAGADDLIYSNSMAEVNCSANLLHEVHDALKKKGLDVEFAQIMMKPTTMIQADQELAEKVLKLLDFLEDIDDVQEVYSNVEFPENFFEE
ncbi:MAG: YebC/PmpR family DNA-binding transcriptional regulator [Gammaproteobacteria bacterium]|jgi:YebC/PmpR family DNA-binding regulatory protein